ncbi:RNA polymerase sigma factor [Amycolatopsis sp. NPDC003861]
MSGQDSSVERSRKALDRGGGGKEGEHEEFDAFFTEFYPRLVQYGARLGLSSEDAVEIAQETMLATYQRWDSVLHSPVAFAYRVFRNRTVDYWRSRARRRDVVYHLDDVLEPEPAPSAEDLALSGRAFVLDALRGLPPQQRMIMAFLLDDLSVQQIAETLEMNESTVRSHARHARKRLARALSEWRMTEGAGKAENL